MIASSISDGLGAPDAPESSALVQPEEGGPKPASGIIGEAAGLASMGLAISAGVQ